jgi:hypothetical protein
MLLHETIFCLRRNAETILQLGSFLDGIVTHESVDRDRDGHWFAQTPRARSSSLSAEGAVLLLAGSGKGGLAPAPAWMER